MTLRLTAAALAAGLFALPALAGGITVADPYALSANPRTGAAFMTVSNAAATPDRLVAARADVAPRVELHTHLMEDGVAKMRQVEGIDVPANGSVALERGGYHVMFIGMPTPLVPGASFPLTLVFQSGEEVTVEVPVREMGAASAHGAMQGGHGGGHGAMPKKSD